LNGCIGSYFCFKFQENLFIIVGGNFTINREEI